MVTRVLSRSLLSIRLWDEECSLKARVEKFGPDQGAYAGNRRVRLGFVVMLALLLVLGGRLFFVQGLDPDGLAAEAVNTRSYSSVLASERGKILDSKGTVLAQSIINYDIVGTPVVNTGMDTFERINAEGDLVDVPRDTGLDELAQALGKPVGEIRSALTGDGQFSYIARSVPASVERSVIELGIPGVESRPVPQRTYPLGAVGGSIVGYTNDSGGAAGLELTMNDRLEGIDGKRTFQTGADGIIIPTAPLDIEPAVNGQSVKLTINSELQFESQTAIETQAKKLTAEWANIIVTEIKTGKIRAMAETGSVDPNDPGATAEKDRGARSVQAALEPGSTEKAITAAAVIEEGLVKASSEFLVPPTYTVNGQSFSDSFVHGTEQRTFAGIIGDSMNTGTVMAGEKLTKEQRFDYLKRFGIGEKTGIPLPGESTGLLADPQDWDGRQEFAVLFGQGVSQTTLQTAMAYQALGNKGLRLKPQLIEAYIDPDGTEHPVQAPQGTRAVSENTAKEVRDILESVVTAGGAKDVKVPGYRIGGKTGTAEVASENGQGFDGFTASFVGMAPMEDPEYVVLVNVHRPQGNIYGISTAPVFNDIMAKVLATYDIAPSQSPKVTLPQKY